MTTIQIIVWPDRKETREAEVYGLFAVHLEEGGRYAITHMATGLLVCRIRGLKAANALATDLNALLPNGDFSNPPDLKDAYYRAFTEAAKAMIEQHGGYR